MRALLVVGGASQAAGTAERAGLNIAHVAVDRHAASAHAQAVALRCVARDDSVSCVTYGDLARATAPFANVLRTLGTGRGDRGVTLLGRCPEL